ncbi:hypothetical protein BGZ76_001354 [Entomortierella beljakovae]|nr:hypothetical protein BGZ76_001354 [Entomortierella beljakovae]
MVRQRTNSNAMYRTSQEIPETPLTPLTPRTPRTSRSPHLHRSRLLTPTLSRTRSSLKREHAEDLDSGFSPSNISLDRIRQSNAKANPTPSEILSMDLDTLMLNTTTNKYGGALPSARLSDEGIEHYSLPFERLLGPSHPLSSPSTTPTKSPMTPSRRYPTRTPTRESQNTHTTPVKNMPTMENITTPPNTTHHPTLISPPYTGSPRQYMNNDPDSPDFTKSPRVIRTPRRLAKAAEQANSSPMVKPFRPLDLISMARQTDDIAVEPFNLSDLSAHSNLYEDDTNEIESVHSSVGGDFEKENHTPKHPSESANPFYVGNTKRQTRSSTKTDGSTTPTGPSSTSGNINRSGRLALGSISPWRWNTFDEQCLASHAKGGKHTCCLDSAGNSSCKADSSVSEWVESILSNQKGAVGTSDNTGSSSSSSQRSRPAVYSKPSTSSSTQLVGPPLGNKGPASKLPESHPNSVESAERRAASSSIMAKLNESVIKPNSVAFNRRAQQLAGQIYYWKHGTYQLVSEQDKQQWPGEWKFEIFQDPESPGAPSQGDNGSSCPPPPPPTTYSGKGKLTDRQLRGPAFKRTRIHRESFSGSIEHTINLNNDNTNDNNGTNSNITFRSNDSDLANIGLVDDEQDSSPPPSPSQRASRIRLRSAKQSQLDARYNFRERRMLNEPLTTRSRRCGA